MLIDLISKFTFISFNKKCINVLVYPFGHFDCTPCLEVSYEELEKSLEFDKKFLVLQYYSTNLKTNWRLLKQSQTFVFVRSVTLAIFF